MNKAFIVILVLFALTGLAHADEGSFTPCNNYPTRIVYSSETSKLYICCSGSAEYLELRIFNPETLIQENVFPISYNGFDDIYPIDNNASFLLLIAELDGTIDTTDGVLQQINSSTGEVENELFFDRWPQSMCIDQNEEYAYVVSGLNSTGKLSKISLSNFQIVNSIDYGIGSNEIEITPDGTKIYANSDEKFKADNFIGRIYKIGVFNTSDLSASTPIELLHSQPILEMGQNGMLYVSCMFRWIEDDPTFFVFDTTNNDEIVTSFNFGPTSLWLMDIDSSGQKLYLTNERKTYYDPEYEDLLFEPSNIVIEINLSDYSSREITFAEGHFWDIAVAAVNGTNRIFCTDIDNEYIYYKDVD